MKDLHSYQIVLKAVDDGTKKLGGAFKPIDGQLNRLKTMCALVDSVMDDQDGTGFSVSADPITDRVVMELTMLDLDTEYGSTHPVFNLVIMSDRFEFVKAPKSEADIQLNIEVNKIWRKV